MSDMEMATAMTHPEEMRAEFELCIGATSVARATARATPASLVTLGILVSAILLSTAVLVRAARCRPY